MDRISIEDPENDVLDRDIKDNDIDDLEMQLDKYEDEDD